MLATLNPEPVFNPTDATSPEEKNDEPRTV